MLGAVVAEDGVGDVGFEELGGPAFPFGEESDELALAALVAVAAEELSGGGGRAGAAVQEGHQHLTFRKSLVKDGEEADDEGDEPEAGAGFKDEGDASHVRFGDDVAEAEREEGGAGDVKGGAEIGEPVVGEVESVSKRGAEAEVEKGEGEGEHIGPESEQNDEGEGAEDGVELVADAAVFDEIGKEGEGAPGEEIEEERVRRKRPLGRRGRMMVWKASRTTPM